MEKLKVEIGPSLIQPIKEIKTELNKKDQEKKYQASKISSLINNKKFTIRKLSTENKELYGSVKPTEISKLILEKNKLDVKPSMIELPKEIKTLGDFQAKINLHPKVQAIIHIIVVADDNV